MKRVVLASILVLLALLYSANAQALGRDEAVTGQMKSRKTRYIQPRILKTIKCDDLIASRKAIVQVAQDEGNRQMIIPDSIGEIFNKQNLKFINLGKNISKYKYHSLNGSYGAIVMRPNNQKRNKLAGTTGNVTLSLFDVENNTLLSKIAIPDALGGANIFISNDGKMVALLGSDDYEFEVSEKTAVYVYDNNGNKIVNYNPPGYFRGPKMQSADGNFIGYLIKSNKFDMSICVLEPKSGMQYEMKDGNININSEVYTMNNDGSCLLKTPCDNSKNEIVTIVNPINDRMVFNEKLPINSNYIISASSRYLFIYNSEGYELLDLFNKNIIWKKKEKRTIKQIVNEHQIKAAFSYDETMACIIEKNKVIIFDLLSGNTLGELKGNYFGTPRKPTEAFFIDNAGLFVLSTTDAKVDVIVFEGEKQ